MRTRYWNALVDPRRHQAAQDGVVELGVRAWDERKVSGSLDASGELREEAARVPIALRLARNLYNLTRRSRYGFSLFGALRWPLLTARTGYISTRP